jgi:hypothetical protein
LTQNATTLSPAAAPSVNVTNATTLSPATAPSVNVTINATLSPAGPTNNITNTTNTTTTAPNTSPVNTTNATMSPATVPSAVTKSPTAAPAPGIPTPRSPIGLPTTDTDEDEDEDEPPTGSPHHEKGESKGPKTGTTPVAESDEGLSAGGIFGIVLVVLFVVVGGAAYMMFGQSSRSSGRYRPDGMRSMEMGRYNSRDDDNGLL